MKPTILKTVDVPMVVVLKENSCVWRESMNHAHRSARAVGQESKRLVAGKVSVTSKEPRARKQITDTSGDVTGYDGYMVRDRFMALKGGQELLCFLNEFGKFTSLAEEAGTGWLVSDLLV